MQSAKKAARERRERWNRAVVAVWQATRRDADMTQDDLAEKLGWSRATVADLENGRRKVEFTDVVLFAYAVGQDPETIVRRILKW